MLPFTVLANSALPRGGGATLLSGGGFGAFGDCLETAGLGCSVGARVEPPSDLTASDFLQLFATEELRSILAEDIEVDSTEFDGDNAGSVLPSTISGRLSGGAAEAALPGLGLRLPLFSLF